MANYFFQDTAFQTDFEGRGLNYNFHPGSIVKIHNYINKDVPSKSTIGPSFSDLLPKLTKPSIELYQPVFKSSSTLFREEISKTPITIVKELPRRLTPIYIPKSTTISTTTTTTSTTTISSTSTTTTTARPLQRPKSQDSQEYLPFVKPWIYEGEDSDFRATRNTQPFQHSMTLDIPG